MTLEELKKEIRPLDETSMEQARKHWIKIAKPLFSLGKLEDAVIQMAGIKETPDYELKKKALVIMCADNGIVEEGVTQTGQEVTAMVADNFTKSSTSVCAMSKVAGVDLFPVDIGMAVDVPSVTVKEEKVAYGTRNFSKEPAMTREEVWQAIEIGIRKVEQLKEQGYEMMLRERVGIGNTTTSSAVASVLLSVAPEQVTGRGAGLSSAGLEKKISVIKDAIATISGQGRSGGCSFKSRRPGYCGSDRCLFRRSSVPRSGGDRRIYLFCSGFVCRAHGAGFKVLFSAFPCIQRTGRSYAVGGVGAFPAFDL